MRSGMIKSIVILIASAFALGVGITTIAAEGTSSRVPGPQFELPTDATQCVRPTEFMRRNHMELLLHTRDETMYNGIRTKKDSLQNCIECHAGKNDEGEAIPVNAPGQFCESCHTYASVKLDCFECHRTTPEVTKKSAKIPQTPEHAHLIAQLAATRENSAFGGLTDDLANYVEEISGDAAVTRRVKQ